MKNNFSKVDESLCKFVKQGIEVLESTTVLRGEIRKKRRGSDSLNHRKGKHEAAWGKVKDRRPKGLTSWAVTKDNRDM